MGTLSDVIGRSLSMDIKIESAHMSLSDPWPKRLSIDAWSRNKRLDRLLVLPISVSTEPRVRGNKKHQLNVNRHKLQTCDNPSEV